jgi:hypothetical protein
MTLLLEDRNIRQMCKLDFRRSRMEWALEKLRDTILGFSIKRYISVTACLVQYIHHCFLFDYLFLIIFSSRYTLQLLSLLNKHNVLS